MSRHPPSRPPSLGASLGAACALCATLAASHAFAQPRPPLPRAVAARTPTETWTYIVRAGDTLIGICRAYLREPREWPLVQRFNRVADPTRLRIGLGLRIPLRMLRVFEGTADAVWTRGDVRAIASDGSVKPLAAGETIAAGSRVETGPGSAVRLRLIDGALITLGENSQMDIRELTVFSYTTAAKTSLSVGRGRVETQVTPPTAPGASYEIATPVVTTSVRGTEFRVGVQGEGTSSSAEVVTGSVAAGAGAGASPLVVDAGFGIVARAGESLAPPRPLPPAPTLTDVPARLERLPLQLTWNAAAGVQRHRARLSEMSLDRTVHEAVVDGVELRVTDVPDGRYTLRVRSIDEVGLEGVDVATPFEVRARPEPPIASEPRHGAKSYGESASFRWTRSDSAETYDFQIASEPTFASPIVDVSGRAETTFSQPLTPGTYYWRVASNTAALGRGPFSDVLSFTQRRMPAARDADAALDKASLMLKWSIGAPGETSQVQLARDREFSQLIVDRTLAESAVTLPRPEPGTYFVRVRALDNEGVAGPFGPTQSIVVPVPPPRRAWWPWLVPPAVAGVLLVLLL